MMGVLVYKPHANGLTTDEKNLLFVEDLKTCLKSLKNRLIYEHDRLHPQR